MLAILSSRSIKALSTYCHNRSRVLSIVANERTCHTLHHQISPLCTGSRCYGPTIRLLHTTRFTLNKSTLDDTKLSNDKAIPPASDGTLTFSKTSGTFPESFTDVPGTTNTKSKTLAIIYTCKVCNTRSAKQFTEHSYRHGVVLVRCPGCQNLHLIADRLGWFEDAGDDGQGWDVEKALTKAGENVKAVSHGDVLELTLDDIVGSKPSED